jgi:cytoskeletal protein CcmA (bactofilin family)
MSGIWRRYTDKKQAFLAPQSPGTVADERSSEPAKFLSPSMRAWIDADAVVSGRLSFSEPTRIDGTLRGEVRATDTLVIGERGLVDGTIRAGKLIILGRVKGQVLEAERVEIGPQGTLRGVLETRTLVLQEGGRIDGPCRIDPHLGERRIAESAEGATGTGSGSILSRFGAAAPNPVTPLREFSRECPLALSPR